MRILITNDDGINAPGLKVLHAIAEELVGPEGEVWTVAPAFEQSGVAHKISYTHPMMVSELGERLYAAEGSPADCVLTALHDVMPDCPPDLVLSGVNRGNNSAENALYSGTLGGAMEAALQGLPAMALSQYYGPENRALDDPFEAALAHGAALIRRILEATPPHEGDYRLFYNINFPPHPASAVKGTKVSRQGAREGILDEVGIVHEAVAEAPRRAEGDGTVDHGDRCLRTGGNEARHGGPQVAAHIGEVVAAPGRPRSGIVFHDHGQIGHLPQ